MRVALIILLLILAGAVYAQTGDKEVEEKLEIVLGELDTEDPVSWDIPQFLKNIIEFISGIGVVFQFLFYTLTGAVVLYIVYRIVNIFMTDKGIDHFTKSEGERISENSQRSGYNKYLKRAHDYCKAGDCSAAVILLHLGSVSFLFEKKLLSKGRDYTNREIFSLLRLLREDELLNSFRMIALGAEQIRFKGVAADKTVFMNLEQIYREHFHE